MIRFYYSDARRALDALLDHGIVTYSLWPDGSTKVYTERSLRNDVGLPTDCQERYYVHPDSLPLLAPKAGDVCQRDEGGERDVWVRSGNADLRYLRTLGAVIIRRDDKPFHWPTLEQPNQEPEVL